MTKVALVTGANRGIGFEIARQLAQLGITVLMGARDQGGGRSACEKLRSSGLDAHFIPVDVTRATSIEAAIGKIRDDFKRLDILVNNAGIQIDTQSGILELDPVIFQNTLETNVFGPLLLAQATLIYMPLIPLQAQEH